MRTTAQKLLFGGALLPSIASLGPTHWFRADKGITLNGSTVSAWADQGSGGKNFTQATATNQPTYVAASSNFNGRPCVQFDGVDNELGSASAWTTHVENSITIAVLRALSSTGEDYWMKLDGTNPYGLAAVHSTSGWAVYNGASAGYYAAYGTSAVILAFCHDWIDSASLLNANSVSAAFYNGAVAWNANTFRSDGTTAYLGSAGGSTYANVEIAELVYFHNRDISLRDIMAVHHELAARYGITLL